MTKDILKTLKLLAIALAITLGVNTVFAAWTQAPASPPNGNVDAPINVGGIGQGRAGGLEIGQGISTGPANGYKLEVNGDANLKGSSWANVFSVAQLTDLWTNTNTQETLKVHRNSANNYVSLGMGSNGGGILNAPNDDLHIQYPSTKNTIINPSGGNAMIGTWTQKGKLNVGGDVNADGDVCSYKGGTTKCLSNSGNSGGGNGGGNITNDNFMMNIYHFADYKNNGSQIYGHINIGSHLFCALNSDHVGNDTIVGNQSNYVYKSVNTGLWYMYLSSNGYHYGPGESVAGAVCLDVK